MATEVLQTKPPVVRTPRNASTIVALAILAVTFLFMCLGRWITPFDPSQQDLMLGITKPSATHWLGTDELGRDILSRVIVGTSGAVVGPFFVALFAILIGTLLGMFAGYRGGVPDTLIGRFVDIVYALPSLLIAIVVIGISGGGYLAVVLVLAFLSLPTAVRMVRSATISEASKPYVEAAKSLRLHPLRIMSRHIFPNILATVVVTFLLDFVIAMIAFSALAFLGFGVEPGSADWGVMIAEGRSQLFLNPAYALAPALMLILVAAAGTLLGDAVYARITAAKERR